MYLLIHNNKHNNNKINFLGYNDAEHESNNNSNNRNRRHGFIVTLQKPEVTKKPSNESKKGDQWMTEDRAEMLLSQSKLIINFRSFQLHPLV